MQRRPSYVSAIAADGTVTCKGRKTDNAGDINRSRQQEPASPAAETTATSASPVDTTRSSAASPAPDPRAVVRASPATAPHLTADESTPATSPRSRRAAGPRARHERRRLVSRSPPAHVQSMIAIRAVHQPRARQRRGHQRGDRRAGAGTMSKITCRSARRGPPRARSSSIPAALNLTELGWLVSVTAGSNGPGGENAAVLAATAAEVALQRHRKSSRSSRSPAFRRVPERRLAATRAPVATTNAPETGRSVARSRAEPKQSCQAE